MTEHDFAVPNWFGVDGKIMYDFYRKIDGRILPEICPWDLTRKSKPFSMFKIRVPKNHSNKNFFYPNKPKGTVVFVKKEQEELVIYFAFFVKEIDKKTLNDILDYTKTIIMVKSSQCQDLRHKLKRIPPQSRERSPTQHFRYFDKNSSRPSRERSPQQSRYYGENSSRPSRERSPQQSRRYYGENSPQRPRVRSQKRSRERSPQHSQKRQRERSPQHSKNYRSGWYIDRNPKPLDERDKLIHKLYSKLYHQRDE